jgi:hypothetical protein
MDPYTQAFIIAAIDIKVEQEKKEASKAKHGKKH